jgi:hypothetical protein
MWIMLVGDPHSGFTVCGPFQTEDGDGARGEAARATYGGNDWYEIELQRPHDPGNIVLDVPLPDDAGYDPNGTAVVFGGDITCKDGWLFYGPFRNIEAARHWCAADDIGNDCAIKLQPVPMKVAA